MAVPFRVGIGYDVHQLVPGRPLRLGGVTIPFHLGLAGHSDGDALTHAVIDALFGACGLPDIGQHFPSGDGRYRDADSITLLTEARRLGLAAGWQPSNVDTVVVCERPRMAPYTAQMREQLAAALDLPVTNVSVKAKTNERLDAVGRGAAVVVHAIILVTARER